jgi:hypothetical protein
VKLLEVVRYQTFIQSKEVFYAYWTSMRHQANNRTDNNFLVVVRSMMKNMDGIIEAGSCAGFYPKTLRRMVL